MGSITAGPDVYVGRIFSPGCGIVDVAARALVTWLRKLGT